jgi:tetratricopeptide (TPR) repeat protein
MSDFRLFRGQRMLAAFVGELARTNDEAKRLLLKAGLTALRLVDAWREGEQPDDWGLARLNAAIADLIPGPEKAALGELVHVFAHTDAPDAEEVASRVFHYGRALECQTRQSLAIHVFPLAIRLIAARKSPLALRSIYRIGQSLVGLGRRAAARSAFGHLRQLSKRWSSREGLAWAAHGEAELAIHAGNYPEAARLLRLVLGEARNDMPELLPRAFGSMAAVAMKLGDHGGCIQDCYSALMCCNEVAVRDRNLCNMAAAYLQLGMLDASRTVNRFLFENTTDQYVRIAAGGNLLEIASKLGDRFVFDQLGAHLTEQPMAAELRVQLQLERGEGLLRFGEHSRGLEFIRSALAMAIEHGANEYIIVAERLLSERRPSEPAAATGPIEGLARIADATTKFLAVGGKNQHLR